MTPSLFHRSFGAGPQAVARAITLGALVVGVAGVALAGRPAPADRTVPSPPARDVATWAMPLDRFELTDQELDKGDYAQQLLIARCLATDGYDWPVPWQNVATLGNGHGDDNSRQVDGPLTAAVAASRGYHVAAVDPVSDGLWQTFVSRPLIGAAEQKAFDTCLHESWKTLPPANSGARAQDASNVAIPLANQDYASARVDSTVLATTKKWFSCMADAGVPDLPETPDLMPSESVQQKYLTSAAAGEATDAEKALAAKDVGCRASSGYTRALYDAEYTLQLRVTADQYAALAAAPIDDQRAYEGFLERVIAKRLPPEPTR